MTTTLPKVQDRLQPALLDRLRDDEPGQTKEAINHRVLSRTELRDAVLRDLRWLFNTACHDTDGSLADHPQARRSVLNYGMPVMSGHTISSIDPVSLETKVRQAIVDFEPRIKPDSLRVEVEMSEVPIEQHNQISFRISGLLSIKPVEMELLLHTDVDLETGRVDVRELSS